MTKTGLSAHLVDWNVWLPPLHGPEGEAALLQLGLWVVPLLVGDELVETGKEADLGEDHAVLQVLVDVEGPDEGLQQVGSVLHL